MPVGLPNESALTRASRLRNLAGLGKIATQHKKEITVFPQLNAIYPGTAHFDEALKQGQFGPNGQGVFEAFTEWEFENQPILSLLGDNFAHGVGGIPIGTLDRSELKQGRFIVNQRSVDDLKCHLENLAQLEGIELFRYGLLSPATRPRHQGSYGMAVT